MAGPENPRQNGKHPAWEWEDRDLGPGVNCQCQSLPLTPLLVQWMVLFSPKSICRKVADPCFSHWILCILCLQFRCVSPHVLCCISPYSPVLNSVCLSSRKALRGKGDRSQSSFDVFGKLQCPTIKLSFGKRKRTLRRQYLENHRKCKFTAFLSSFLLLPPFLFDPIFTEPLYVHWAVYFLELCMTPSLKMFMV